MNKVDIAKNFAASFKQAGGNTTPGVFSSCIRFIAIMMVVIAVIWCINHFMDSAASEQDGFLIRLGSQSIRIVVALCLFILILLVKGN